MLTIEIWATYVWAIIRELSCGMDNTVVTDCEEVICADL
jgi:hypothetical protein